MGRDAKILSVIAAGILAVALGLVAYTNYQGARDGLSSASDNGQFPVNPLPGQLVSAGKLAADFTLRDLHGNDVSLTALRGKVVFLNIWATWCAPCRSEMPSIETLYEEFSNDPGVVLLAVSQDSAARGDLVASYMHKNGFKFTVLLDPQNQVGEAYDVTGIPETFIIDRRGRIVAHHIGPFDWALPEMRDALRDLIDSKNVKQTARAG